MKSDRALASLVLALLVAFPAGCGGHGGGGGGSATPQASTPASQEAPTVALCWFGLLYRYVKAESVPPPAAARMYAIAGVVLYESIVEGMPGRRALRGQLVELPADAIAPPTAERHHWVTVANHALASVVRQFFPDASEEIDFLESEFDERALTIESAATVERSAARGDEVARALLTWCANDGIDGLDACAAGFEAPIGPAEGGWSPTGAGQGVGAAPCWGTLRCFALPAIEDCAAEAHPPYSTSPASEFHAHATLVRDTTGDLGANLSDEQRAIAFYWADGPGATGTPAGHWISIVGAVVEQQHFKLDRAAEAYARVGIAIADAFIACWRAKYAYYLMRPVTYIQGGIDPDWTPLLATPGFPSYVSGHSTQSAAAATTLTLMLGPLAFVDTTHAKHDPELGLGTRTFPDFRAAATEAAISRLYGGIHYDFDNRRGFDQGVCVAKSIFAAIDFDE